MTFNQKKINKELENILSRFFERIIDRNTAVVQIDAILSTALSEAREEERKSFAEIIGEDEKLEVFPPDDNIQQMGIWSEKFARNKLKAKLRVKLSNLSERKADEN